jgi:hypothetical protein
VVHKIDKKIELPKQLKSKIWSVYIDPSTSEYKKREIRKVLGREERTGKVLKSDISWMKFILK